jgi:hypothetical protein
MPLEVTPSIAHAMYVCNNHAVAGQLLIFIAHQSALLIKLIDTDDELYVPKYVCTYNTQHHSAPLISTQLTE